MAGIAYDTYTALTVTNLQSLANDSTDPFGAWQSAIVDNRTELAVDREFRIHLPTAATAPANDQVVYVYLIPWVHDGTNWLPGANFGTTTLPTGSEGTASISEPNSMYRVALPYKVTSQIVQGYVTVLGAFSMHPDGVSVAIRNCSGAALSTGCAVSHRPVTYG